MIEPDLTKYQTNIDYIGSPDSGLPEYVRVSLMKNVIALIRLAYKDGWCDCLVDYNKKVIDGILDKE